MRILLLAPGFPRPSDVFGAAVGRFVEHLGHRHNIVVQAVRPPPVADMDRGPVTVLGSKRGPRTLRAAQQSARLWRRHRRQAFDAVWSMWPDRTGLFALALAQAWKRPLVLSLMGGEIADHPDLSYGGLRSRRNRLKMRALFQSATRVTAGSQWLADLAQNHFPRTRIDVMPIGVDVAAIRVKEDGPRAKSQSLEAVAVSNLSPVKQLNAAVKAIEHLRRQGIDASLDVYGLDPKPQVDTWRKDLETEGRATFIRYCGAVPYSDLCQTVARYHVLVHPSTHEAQGLAMIEAALARVPIAALRVGVAETLQNLGAAVELVDEPTPRDLGRAIENAAVHTPGELQEIRDHFGLDATAATFDRIFREVSQ